MENVSKTVIGPINAKRVTLSIGTNLIFHEGLPALKGFSYMFCVVVTGVHI